MSEQEMRSHYAVADRLERRMAALRREVAAISGSVASARREIAALKPASLACNDLPAASDRLDAVMRSSAVAADRIMDGAEALLSLAPTLPEGTAGAVADIAVNILEAAAFQDVTGQHIARVTIVLRTVEARLARLAAIIGDQDFVAPPAPQGPLAEGPAIAGEGIAQDDVDRLFGT